MVRYRGHDLRRLGRDERRTFRRDVQAIFQDPYGVYNPFYRVDHVLTDAGAPLRPRRLAQRGARPDRRCLARGRACARRRSSAAIRTSSRAASASASWWRARCLPKPKLIVADEPVSMVDASLRATILGSLRRLTDEHGISILYITHDLATAYQVSDAILVLYRAHLAEAGAVEPVVRRPQHPYTQLLVSAIPRAHAERDWLAQENETPRTGVALTPEGCVFADRCPHAVELCLAAPPTLYRTEPRRGVACVQYREHAVLSASALGEVLLP